MKVLNLLLILACASFVTCGVAGAVESEELVSENHFHLFTKKCENEANEGPDTTPHSPPLNVDDPATPGCDRWEINVVVDGDIARASKSWELPLLDINYGIGDNLQLKYEVPNVNTQVDDTTAAAVGESRAGVKYMFFEDEASKLQLAVYPQMTFINADSDAIKKGIASAGTVTTLPLLLSKKIGQTSRGEVNLSANFGYNISTKEEVKDFISAAVGVGMPLFRRISVLSEISTEQALSARVEEDRDQIVKAAVGLVGPISNKFLLFGSVGRSLYSSDQLDHTFVLAGFKLLTGGIAKQ
jgi:hypothetical protein